MTLYTQDSLVPNRQVDGQRKRLPSSEAARQFELDYQRETASAIGGTTSHRERTLGISLFERIRNDAVEDLHFPSGDGTFHFLCQAVSWTI